MPKLLAVFVTLAMLQGAGVVLGAEDLILGFRGKSKYQIVVPDTLPKGAIESSVTDAADLLKAAFAANAITLEVKRESQVDNVRPAFYLGATKFAAAHHVDLGKLKGWGYVHKVVGRDIVIAGNDQPDPLVGKRATSKGSSLPDEGTFFGAAEFAYRYLGARFLAQGETGTTFVPVAIIHVPCDLDVQRSPYFTENDFRDSNDLFWRANHCRSFQRVWSRWGHQHPSAVPIAEYGKTHPEYIILTGGVRQPTLTSQDGQLCLSNPEVRELIYRHILARCDEGFDVVELGQADGFRPCQCPQCAKLYGVKPGTLPTDGLAYHNDPAWGEKIWIMHRDMAVRLLKDRPGKTIMMTSYGPTSHPPRTFSEFPPNTVIEMMHSTADAFDEWRAIKAPGGFSAYLYTWGSTHFLGITPMNTVSKIAEQNRLLAANHVRMVQLNGRPVIGQWGLEGPNIYVYVRLGIDPQSKSADELFNEYVEAAFRECETPMRRFFLGLQKRVELLEPLSSYVRKTDRDPLFVLGTLYTPDLLNSLDEDLAMAEKSAELPEVKRRLDMVRYEFEYLKHLARTINAWRNYQTMNDRHSLDQLLDAVDARNAFIAKVVNGDGKYGKRKNPTYLYASEESLKYSERRCLDRAPLNWDTAKVRATHGNILHSVKSVDVTRTDTAPTLDSPLWGRVEAHMLGPVEGATDAVSAETTFKLLYDHENLYVRVSAQQPGDKMTFVPRGRDAELWLQESIVINLSPTAAVTTIWPTSPNTVHSTTPNMDSSPIHCIRATAGMTKAGTASGLSKPSCCPRRTAGSRWW